MKKIMYLSVFLIIIFTCALAIANERAAKSGKDCMPWENFTGDKCVDKEGVFRPENKGKGFVMPSHLRCFSECGCAPNQDPADPSCAPCRYIGVVCMPR